MSDGSDRWQELDSLLDRVLDGIYDDGDLRRLNEILRDDAEACRRYVLYVELHGRLAWGDGLRGREGEIGVPAARELAGSADLVGSVVQLPANDWIAMIRPPTNPLRPLSLRPRRAFRLRSLRLAASCSLTGGGHDGGNRAADRLGVSGLRLRL